MFYFLLHIIKCLAAFKCLVMFDDDHKGSVISFKG